MFGCWTSVSRKSVLPVFEELNGLLFYPVQYEGEESSNNVFYTGAAPNQQAIPAVEYLMGEEGGAVKRWVLEGTDYVYPRTTNKILEAFLKSKGVAPEDIKINYTPFGYSDWQTEVAAIKSFASAGKKTAVVSTINGDANVPFYKELANAGIKASDIPVVAFSVGEEELAGIDTKNLVGHLAAWNYFEVGQEPDERRVHQAVARLHQESEAGDQRPDGGPLHRLQDVDAGRQAGRHDRRRRGPPGDVRPEGKGAERLRRGHEHQPSSVEAGDDRRRSRPTVSSTSSGRPRTPSRRMPGAPISPKTRARSPTGPIPGSAAIAPRPNTLIEARRSALCPHPPRCARHPLPRCGRGAMTRSPQSSSLAPRERGANPKVLVGEGGTIPQGSRDVFIGRGHPAHRAELTRITPRAIERAARLTAIVLLVFSMALPARADEFATLLPALASDGFAEKEQAVIALGKLGDERAVTVLTALKDGRLIKAPDGHVCGLRLQQS